MSAHLYFLVIGTIVLAVSSLLLRRGSRRSFDWESYGTEEETALPFEWDSLTSELCAKIFNPEDSDFVASESSGQFARKFRQERTVLALDWLRGVRSQVNLLMRAHVRAARWNPDLRPADELRLGFDFLLFQLTSGILYVVIWVQGPLHASKLVGYSLGLTRKLREITDVLPVGRPVAVELMDMERQGNGRTAAP